MLNYAYQRVYRLTYANGTRTLHLDVIYNAWFMLRKFPTLSQHVGYDRRPFFRRNYQWLQSAEFSRLTLADCTDTKEILSGFEKHFDPAPSWLVQSATF